jgi:hypothetical protein
MNTRTVRLACLSLVAWFGLAACADTHWERAFYQGARQGSTQCQLQRKPTDPPCAELLDYDRYTRERAKARGAAANEEEAP